MIGYLEGRVLQVLPKTIIVVTTAGVGYELFPTGSLLSKCNLDGLLTCFVHTLVREQEISLYGFETLEERQFFEKLIGISGVGPKMALQILSQPVGEFISAIDRGDVDFVMQTPGIGKKMAQKLIVELKGKIDLSEEVVQTSVNKQEATEALKSLGYDESTVKFVLGEAPEDLSTEDLIKFFLSNQS